jgi:hypothetical protein
MLEKYRYFWGHIPFALGYYLKNLRDFAIKCQKALAICAKDVYNNNAIL